MTTSLTRISPFHSLLLKKHGSLSRELLILRSTGMQVAAREAVTGSAVLWLQAGVRQVVAAANVKP
ncbi:hypothetical protein FRB95_000844 [Tulasnella sp. JGI-2019a]|nr:hypothetical protein FRB93_000849 [Tulasnella sp. JGI-2019a]KAG9032910.1 hypothetical protein FRB95_000844 [Tulasnella sp. JGI-2019a]